MHNPPLGRATLASADRYQRAAGDAKRRRMVTIRRSLIRNLALLLVLLTGAMLVAASYFGIRVRDDMAGALTGRALEDVEARLRSYFEPVERQLRIAQRLVRNGSLDLDDPSVLRRHFVPVLASVPGVSSVNVGDASGAGFLLMRMGDRWRTRLVRVDEWGPRQELAEWSDEGTPLREWTEEPGAGEVYDPRRRDWYLGVAEGSDEVFWTEPYTFFTTREPGITAMVRVEDPRGHESVLAIDVLLRSLSDFTRSLDVSEGGIGAVLTEDGKLLGLPGLPRFGSEAVRNEAYLQRPRDSGVAELKDAAATYQRLNAPELFSFESGGERFWAEVRDFPLGPTRKARTFVLIPEGDLVGAVNQLRYALVLVAAFGFGGALGLSVLLARRYSRPLATLADNSERIGSLDLRELVPVKATLREVDQLATEQERMRIALDSFSRYVPVDVVRELMTQGEAARIGGSRREVTALFTDIRGFTSVAEAMDPEVLTAHLAEYFEELLGILQGDGFGTVTQLTGDGLIGFWGAPRSDDEHARHAAAAVLACSERMDELNEKWCGAGKPELYTRFGLASGAAVVGNVGAMSRLVYTAIGDTVNLASRLEGLGRFYGTHVLASQETRDRAAGFVWRRVDVVRVKGKSEPVGVYELLGAQGRVTDARLVFARRYEEALEFYCSRRFAEACGALEGLAAEHPNDLSVTRLLGLARRLEGNPPDASWDGVSDFFEK